MAERAESVTGLLKIDIPTPALSVSLTFQVSDDGDEWDADRLSAALKERNAPDVPRDTLAAFIENARSSSDTVSTTVLEGIEPELPSPEHVVWNEELSMPDHLTEFRDRVLERASSPQIFREVRETVEKKKDVSKKGMLGIGSRTETVTVTDTATRREKVFIDPSVEQVWSVSEDEALGKLVPPDAGKPGKDIFGRPVPAKQPADPRFYLGDNLTRKGDTVVAGAEGFLRVGRNWADIVPYAPHRWTVELSEDQATCYLTVTPGSEESPLPDGGEILETAVQLPYPESSLMSVDELQRLVKGQIASGEAAQLPISSSRDASFHIVVSEDKLQALLYIHKGKGRGKKLNLKEVGAAIKGSRLKGLNLQKISEDIKAFYNTNEFDLTGYLLTEGTAPTPGPRREVEFSVRFEDETGTQKQLEALRAAAPEDTPESLTDFPADAIQRTARVEHDQLLATIDPATPGEAGTDVFGATIAPSPGATPVFHLYENVEQKDVIIATTAPGVLDYAEIDGEYHLRVRAHVDAQATVDIAPDKMSATLSLREGAGTGRRLNREIVQAALDDAGVSHGIREEAIKKALAAAKAGTAVDTLSVAEGTPAVDQSENTLEMAVDTDHGPAVRIRNDGTADYRTQNSIVTVQKGQELCRILPSQQEPIDGVTVTGEAVPAKSVTGLQIEFGDNIEQREQEDGSVLLVAATEGEFVYGKDRMEVRTTHTIKGDVDMSVGNIKFPGTVLIGGTVRAGFYVMSGGDIKIAGGVEAALLSSEGDIVIKQGVKGAGKAVLRSKNNIMSPFVELATLLSVGDVVLKTAIVRSRIKCNGRIMFQGDKGRLVGGTIRARRGIEATSVGSPRGVKTTISFGQDYLIADLIEKEEKEIEKVKTRISQLDIEMNKAEKGSEENQLQALRKEKVKMLKLMEKRGLRLFTLRERFEQHFPSKVVVRGEVHSGTIFESHGRTYEVTTARKGVSVEFDPHTGNLGVSDLNGS
ncbi:MAG: flagellar assembly protein A [Alkalispirochaeta sp.]